MALGVETVVAPPPAPLVAALMNERQLLSELRRALAQQRAGVASGDPAVLDLASQAVSRAILTLDETRRRREQLMQLASHGRPVRLEHLEATAGPIAGLTEARQALKDEAEATVRELAETQDLLQAAIRSGNAYLQSLFASVSQAAASLSATGAPTVPAPGLLVNRRA